MTRRFAAKDGRAFPSIFTRSYISPLEAMSRSDAAGHENGTRKDSRATTFGVS
jgi:hypothetical protein